LLLILAEPALAVSLLWKRRELSIRRNVVRDTSTGGHSERVDCWKQAMTHLRRAPITGINKVVDKIVNDHVDESKKPSIIDDFKLFA
jgi:hypothetical protein